MAPDARVPTVTLEIAQLIVTTFEAYALAGVGFGLLFLPRAVTRVDPGVSGAPIALRLLILPGIVALWPLFAWRWVSGTSAPIEHNPHRAQARQPMAVAGRSEELPR